MKISETLRAAADLLERGWTQGYFAKDANGDPCPFLVPSAVCYCVMGATGRIDDSSDADIYLERFLGVKNLAMWNDAPERTQEEVVSAVRNAAAKAKSEGL